VGTNCFLIKYQERIGFFFPFFSLFLNVSFLYFLEVEEEGGGNRLKYYSTTSWIFYDDGEGVFFFSLFILLLSRFQFLTVHSECFIGFCFCFFFDYWWLGWVALMETEVLRSKVLLSYWVSAPRKHQDVLLLKISWWVI
jgi:hypothetical protein